MILPQKRTFGPYTLNYVDEGRGEVLLFLHNGGGFWQIWEHQIRHFSQTHRVIALDWLGFGESDEWDGPIRLELLYAVLRQFLDGLAIPRLHIIGNCIGASVGLLFQQRHPDRVQKLVLCNVCPGRRVLRSALMRYSIPRIAQSPFWRERVGAVLLFVFLKTPVKRIFPRILFGKQVDKGDPLFQYYLTRHREKRHNLARANLLFGVDSFSLEDFYQPSPSVRPLLIWGEENRVASLRQEGYYHQQVLDTEDFKVMPEMGHLCMYEDPEAFNALIQAELNRVVPA